MAKAQMNKRKFAIALRALVSVARKSGMDPVDVIAALEIQKLTIHHGLVVQTTAMIGGEIEKLLKGN